MSKRRISKQQSARIQKIQAGYREETTNNPAQQEGLVISRFGKRVELEDKQGQRFQCAIRPNLESLVAGDQVIWEPHQTQGVVVSRYPRCSVLERIDKRGQSKPVAANISQMMIVTAPKPELSWILLDSYIALAENLGLQLTIILNKTDLPCDALKTELFAIYEPLGYPLLFTNKIDNTGYEDLQAALNNNTSVFVGQSGVGKSSLIAGILPHETNITTAEISSSSELGCHTTSNSRWYHLPTGGAIIDSPGVREFDLSQMPKADIIYGFKELRVLRSECRFRNCKHIDTPGCALIEAVEAGWVAVRRYNHFIKLNDLKPNS